MNLAAGTTDPHSAHLALVFGALAVLTLAVTTADLWYRFRRVPSGLRAAAVLAVGAAAVHAAVVPEHLRKATSLGLFFLATAAAQVIWSVLVLTRSSRPLLVSGVVGSAGLLVLWTISRTIGLPVGPESGVVESVGVADLLASAAELGLVVLVSAHLLRTTERAPQPTPPAAIKATPTRVAATPMS